MPVQWETRPPFHVAPHTLRKGATHKLPLEWALIPKGQTHTHIIIPNHTMAAAATSQVSTKRFFYERYKELIISVGGVKTKSTFQVEGTLTPLEFLEAGNALVQKAPTWEWAAGPASYLPALPTDKKYLVMRDVPSQRRVEEADLTGGAADETDAGGEWTVTAAPAQQAGATATVVVGDGNGEGDWGEDPDAVPTAAAPQSLLRRYNVYLVYDAYYCTPRVYVSGYNANNQPLTREEMFQDVFSTNRDKTVTVDAHPVLGHPCMSVHPCRHAETMQRNLQRLEERFNDDQEAAGVDAAHRTPFVFPVFLALFVFLRFITSVIPTIEYDVGIDVEN
jgi:ubiquitin-like-conjugating enzyme ATG3